jgi:hypothetical protein
LAQCRQYSHYLWLTRPSFSLSLLAFLLVA